MEGGGLPGFYKRVEMLWSLQHSGWGVGDGRMAKTPGRDLDIHNKYMLLGPEETRG